MLLKKLLRPAGERPAPALPKKFVQTTWGRIAYLERGPAGAPPVLFVHGIPTSSYLWREVMGALAEDYHCYAPDLMGLGDSEVDPQSTEFHMDAQAEMLAEFMGTLGHERFSVVCHDQGGAAAQILVTRYHERIEAFVITDCVGYDNWPVPLIARMQDLARLPLLSEWATRSGLMSWLQTRRRLSQFRTGVYRKENLTDETIREYLRPMESSPEGYARFRAFLLAGDSKYSQRVVPELRKFNQPTLIVWATDDRYLSVAWAKRFLDDIPGAERIELIAFCGHFWQEEKPLEFAEKIGAFLALHAQRRPGAANKKAAPKRVPKKKTKKKTKNARKKKPSGRPAALAAEGA